MKSRCMAGKDLSFLRRARPTFGDSPGHTFKTSYDEAPYDRRLGHPNRSSVVCLSGLLIRFSIVWTSPILNQLLIVATWTPEATQDECICEF